MAKPVPASVAAQKRKAELAFSSFERRLCTETNHAMLPTPAPNLCSTLSALEMTEGRRELVAFLQDKKYHHYMYIARKDFGSLQSQTLEEVISSSPLFPWIAPREGWLVLNRRDRLHLAVKLACSVLQLHESWLGANWSSRDIMFSRESTEPKELLRQPFLLWNDSKPPEEMASRALSSVSRSETLFPLGLALIELSLCRTITALRISEDENPDEEVALLKTANRCLNHIYVESSTRYGDVVQQCLF